MTISLSQIKSKVINLYETNPDIHISIVGKRDRKHLSNVSAEITAVYPNIFSVSFPENGIDRTHTFQYADLLIHDIKIAELNI